MVGRVGAHGAGVVAVGRTLTLLVALAAGWIFLACARDAFAADVGPATRPAAARSGESFPAAAPSDGNRFPVSRFTLQYRTASADLPAPAELMKIPIRLGRVADGYVVPPALAKQWESLIPSDLAKPADATRRPERTIHLADISAADGFYTSAIWAIGKQITNYLNERKIVGVYVVPDSAQIQQAGSGQDLRPPGQASLRLIIFTGNVSQLRTIASGERLSKKEEANRIDNRIHQWILDNSPIQAPKEEIKNGGTTLLRRDLLDGYIDFLNRAPGRHVDAAISATSSGEPGAVALDYLVNEARPWTVYAQVSNTGTKDTNEWRERFGFTDYQLTNHDDIFSLDYSTAGFEKSHDVLGSYDFPLTRSRRLRAKIYGDYDQFTASDVGLSANGPGQSSEGTEYAGGAELVWNVFQHRNLFLDLVAGARYEHARVSAHAGGSTSTGSADFAVPYGGVRLEKNSDIDSTGGELLVEGRFTGADTPELDKLGRLSTDSDAVLLTASFTKSFFLEPILTPKTFERAGTGGVHSTLAHEMVFSVRGQYAFDYRVIPVAEEVAGGLNSVRGYPESISAGDTVAIGTAEYRFHLPRVLAVEQQRPNTQQSTLFGQRFHLQPPQVFGRPDWDLILRGFVDAARTINNQRESFEHDDTLVGTGVGVEFDFKSNLTLRVDWGVALSAIPKQGSTGKVDPGDNRVHFLATFSY